MRFAGLEGEAAVMNMNSYMFLRWYFFQLQAYVMDNSKGLRSLARYLSPLSQRVLSYCVESKNLPLGASLLADKGMLGGCVMKRLGKWEPKARLRIKIDDRKDTQK